jgi:hypothetical protein
MPPRPSSDPRIKVTVFMPASVYQRLREHAERTRSTMSRVCREGALRALADAEPRPPAE